MNKAQSLFAEDQKSFCETDQCMVLVVSNTQSEMRNGKEFCQICQKLKFQVSVSIFRVFHSLSVGYFSLSGLWVVPKQGARIVVFPFFTFTLLFCLARILQKRTNGDVKFSTQSKNLHSLDFSKLLSNGCNLGVA